MKLLHVFASIMVAAAGSITEARVDFCGLGGAGEAAVSLEISGGEDGAACLTFRHDRAPDSSLVGIYIDCNLKSPFLEDTVIINGEGVEFRGGGSPGELPGGRMLNPPFETDFYFTAAPPAPHNGVGPGELVALCFCMPDGMGSDDLEQALRDGRIRIGLRITSGEGSGSFVSRRCEADFNCDWALDVNDFAAFQRSWLAGEEAADFDHNGRRDIRDFIAFHAAFEECGGR